MKPSFPPPFVPPVEADLTIWIPTSILNPPTQVEGSPVNKKTIHPLTLPTQLPPDLFSQFWRDFLVSVDEHDPLMGRQISGILILVPVSRPFSLEEFISKSSSYLHRPVIAEGVYDDNLIGPYDAFQSPFDRFFIIIGNHVNRNFWFLSRLFHCLILNS